MEEPVERADGPEARLRALGVTLPDLAPLTGNYVRGLVQGELLLVSGHLPDSAGPPEWSGKVGRDCSTDEAYAAARWAAICLLSTVKATLGDLDRVVRVVKVLGLVNSAEDFVEQTIVINGASDLLCEVFGADGLSTRSAIGVAQLPRNNCVELEAMFAIHTTDDAPSNGSRG